MNANIIKHIKIYTLQIKHDIVQGFIYNRKKFVLILLFFCVICLFCNREINTLEKLGYINSNPGMVEYILYFSEGMREYIPNSEIPFQIPFAWLSVNLLLAYIIGDYVIKDLHTIGTQMIIRSSQRKIWIFGKIVYCIFCVLFVYLLETFVCFLFGLFSENIHLNISQNIWEIFYGINPSLYSLPELISGLILLPVFTSIVISIFQVFLTIYIKPIYSFIVISVYMIASAYWKSYMLIGNYSMFLRNWRICEKGMVQTNCFIGLVCVCLALIVLLIISFHKYDIIQKK